MNLDVGGKDLAVQFLGLCFDSLQDILRLLAAQHENDALDGIVIFLEAEFAETWRVPDGYISYVAHADGHAFVGANHNVSNVIGVAYQPDAANVVELSTLRIEPAAGIRVVGSQCGSDLRNRQMVTVDAGRVEQHLILHYRSAETGVVRHAVD